jgi:hypothetical protein
VPVERAQVAGGLGGCSVEDVWMLSVCCAPDSRSAKHAVQSSHRTVSKSASRTPGPVCRGECVVCGDSGSRNPLFLMRQIVDISRADEKEAQLATVEPTDAW